MKKTLRFFMLTLFLAAVGGANADTVEKVVYTYTPQANSSNSAYADVYDVEYDGMKWSVPGNQYENSGLRIGGKSITEENRTITGKTQFSYPITKVAINHSGTSGSITLNSVMLTTASDENFTSDVKTVTLTNGTDYTLPTSVSDTGVVAGTLTLSVEDQAEANSYCKIDFNVTVSGSSNKYIKIASIDFYAKVDESNIVAEPTFSPEAGTYYEAQSVTITQADGKEIYYTTDGSDPTTSGTAVLYNSPITVSETTTVSAVAKDGDKYSSIVSAKYVIAETINSFKELQAAATSSTSTPAVIKFNNVIVTAVNKSGNNFYVVDEDGDGALIYASSGGFNAGDLINGSANGAYQLYYGKAEITGITASSDGLTITSGNDIPNTTVTIDQISKSMQSSLVTIKYLTLTETSNTFTDGTNSILLYNSVYVDTNGGTTLPEFDSNNVYAITGIVVYYNDTVELGPRNENDIVVQGDVTGIDNVIATDAASDGAVYNLAGQRVDDSYKGVVIQNGKKVLRK